MRITILICSIVVMNALPVGAQFSIGWHKVAGGGGTSSGGEYTLSGTIGQHDASPVLTGGDYSLIGGFWAAAPASSPGSPLLSIRLTATNTVLITWPSPSTGFVLEQNSNLGGSSWASAPENVADDGTTKSVVVNPPMGTVYYRLKY